MSSLLGTESERVYFVARNVYEVTWSLRGAAESFAGRLDREATEAFSSPQLTKRAELVLLCPIHHRVRQRLAECFNSCKAQLASRKAAERAHTSKS
jgi:hypothetical protein